MYIRPKFKIHLTTIDVIIEVFGWLAFIGVWILMFLSFSDLPEKIPLYYKKGNINKSEILILPMLSTIIFVGLSMLQKQPHIFRYPISITEENARRCYTDICKLIRFSKLIILLMFGVVIYKITESCQSSESMSNIWFLTLILILVIILIIYFSYKLKQPLNKRYS
jgi:RsiW-degrading membrane proteinase PrsW (M82 family)